MHKKDCCYEDNIAMLYALVEVIEKKMILISAPEVCVFDNYLEAARNGDKDISIDLDSCEREPYQLVYGALMFHDIDVDVLKSYVEDIKGYALINLDGEEFGKLKASLYKDICLYEGKGKHKESIPFVALMQTACREEEYTSTTLFPCCDRNIWENLVNRSFLLACRKFVRIDGVTLENWKEYIDAKTLEEAYRIADLYTGDME